MNRRLIFFAALLITLLMTIPFVSVHAASKKNVYICTKVSITDCSEDNYSIDASGNCIYHKNGLLKSIKGTALGGAVTSKVKFNYNKKSLIKSETNIAYLFGSKWQSGTEKYKYNKKGYLIKTISYNEKGKKTGSTSIKYNAKGYAKKVKEYNAKGKVTGTRAYTVNKKGRITSKKTYNKSGALKEKKKYKYSKNKCKISTYNKNNRLISTTFVKYKGGRPVTEVTYDEIKKHKKSYIMKYKYKKIKTSKHKLVKRQQYMFVLTDLLSAADD